MVVTIQSRPPISFEKKKKITFSFINQFVTYPVFNAGRKTKVSLFSFRTTTFFLQSSILSLLVILILSAYSECRYKYISVLSIILKPFICNHVFILFHYVISIILLTLAYLYNLFPRGHLFAKYAHLFVKPCNDFHTH